MVGWSRRSRESDERRAAWWASLTEDERAAETLREAEIDRRLSAVLAALWALIMIILVVCRMAGWL